MIACSNLSVSQRCGSQGMVAEEKMRMAQINSLACPFLIQSAQTNASSSDKSIARAVGSLASSPNKVNGGLLVQ